MSFFKNMKVAYKLWLLVTPVTIMAAFFLIQLCYQINKISADAEKNYYDILYTNTKEIINADRDFYQSAIAEKEYVLAGDALDADEKQSLLKDYTDNYGQVMDRASQVNENLKKEKELYNDYVESESNRTFSQLYESFTDKYNQWLDAYDPATGKGDYAKQESYFAEARPELDHMTNLLDEYSKKVAAETEQSVRNYIITIIITISILTVLVTCFAANIIRYLRRNIVKLTTDMNALANNDLTFEPHAMDSKDELGTLTGSISTLIYSLRAIVTRLVTTSAELTKSSGSMRISSDEVTASMNEIAKTIGEIAEGASGQAEDAQQLVHEIADLGNAVNMNTESAMALAKSSQKIMAASQDGLNTVNQLEDITLKNQEAFQSIFDIINTTNTKAGKISEASAMISDIAKKTKLLALNASIEAASAGEAGRGFAVVAEEIRKLSEQSKNSTRVIDQMISEVADSIKTANNQSNIVKDAVQIQTVSVTDTKEKYLAIVNALNNINKEIATLDTVSTNMERSRAVVSDIGANLSAISEEYAASTEETSATSQEVLAAMTNIEQIGIEVDNLVAELNEIINKFRLIK